MDEQRTGLLRNVLNGTQAPTAAGKLLSEDVAWLLAERKKLGQTGKKLNLQKANLRGCDLSGFDLREVELAGADLAGAKLRRTVLKAVDLTGAHLESADLSEAKLNRAQPMGAHLEMAILNSAHLEGAVLDGAHLDGCTGHSTRLEGSRLRNASLSGADLSDAHLEGADLTEARLAGREPTPEETDRLSKARQEAFPGQSVSVPSKWSPTKLQRAFFNQATKLDKITLGDGDSSGIFVVDVRWGDVNLAVLSWRSCKKLGEDLVAETKHKEAKQSKPPEQRAEEYKVARRACMQLAARLRDQGLNREADQFALRGFVLDRKAAWFEADRHPLRWAGSFLLNLIAGYGYRLWASVCFYVATIAVFALAYSAVSIGSLNPVDLPHAALISVLSFHGRGFPPGSSIPDNVAFVSAAEAVVGLVIEVTFIVCFTQRVFRK